MQIEIKGLKKQFKNTTAINGIDLRIGQGMFGLLGPNGAGKSTLMQILVTLQRPTEGTVKIGDYTLGKDDQSIRRMIGYLPQEYGVHKKLTAKEYLEYIAIMKGISNTRERKKQIAEMLERVNLSDVRNKAIGGFSGGMKQRVGIAQALLGDPKVIIVDEPTAGLDPEERIRFRNLLGDMSRERIVILSTHIIGDIESTCSELAIMKKGTIVFNGTQEQLIERVDGKVWSGIVSEESLVDMRMNQHKHIVVSARKASGGQEVRVLAQGNPFAGARSESATLEDGYMLVMGELPHA